MTSLFLIVGGVLMMAEGIRWTRRHGITTTWPLLVVLAVLLPVINLCRVAKWIGANIAEWLVAPAARHARWRWGCWRANRAALRSPTTSAQIGAIATQASGHRVNRGHAHLPPPPQRPLELGPAAVQPLALGPARQPVEYTVPVDQVPSFDDVDVVVGPDGSIDVVQETGVPGQRLVTHVMRGYR